MPWLIGLKSTGERQSQGAGGLDLMADFEGAIVGGVVDGEDLDIVLFGQSRRNPRQNALDGPLGVVGHHEDQHPGFFRLTMA